jgi:hypothetical protein
LPEPPKTNESLGINEVLFDVAVSVNKEAGVSVSLTLKLMMLIT